MAKSKIPKSTTPGTTVANITIALGLVTATGRAKTVKKPGGVTVSFKTLCPGCLGDYREAVAVTTNYTCHRDHGPYLPADCTDRGYTPEGAAEGELVRFTSDEVAAVKGAPADDDLDSTTLNLQPHPAEQVSHLYRQTGIVYFFEPTANTKLVGMLIDLLAEPDIALMGQVFIKGARRVVRLVPRPHGLELVEMVREAEVLAFDPVSYEYGAADLAVGLQLVEALMTDYDPAMYEATAAARLAALLEAKADGADTMATITALPRPTGEPDLEAQLAASLAAVRAAKAA